MKIIRKTRYKTKIVNMLRSGKWLTMEFTKLTGWKGHLQPRTLRRPKFGYTRHRK